MAEFDCYRHLGRESVGGSLLVLPLLLILSLSNKQTKKVGGAKTIIHLNKQELQKYRNPGIRKKGSEFWAKIFGSHRIKT